MKLIIAEKPELARAIAEAISGEKKVFKNKIETKEYTICWAVGHVLRNKEPQEIDIKLKKWDLSTLPIYFDNWEKTVINGKEDVLDNILNLIKKANEIIHAGDPDDEGQYLIDEILEYANCNKPIKRILINDNSIEAIRKAFTKLENNSKYTSLGKAAEARSISDILLGINLSRFFTLYNNSQKPLTVGRVQTPTLALVVNRDYEIENHVKEMYYELFLNSTLDNTEIKLKYNNAKENITDKSILENIISKLQNKKGILNILKKEEYSSTPLPFNLAKLQIEANKKFGYNIQQVLDITQSLRDKHKAITYNRSDSEYLSEEHFKEAPKLVPELLKELGMNNIKVDFSIKNKSRCFNEEYITAHHAIIPTFNVNLAKFTLEEKNIYMLIAKRYLIQFMDKEKIEKTEAILNIENEIFKVNSKKVLEEGYTKIYEETKEDGTKEDMNSLSKLSEGKYEILIDKANLNIQERETKAKKHYTEATLLQDMTSISKYVKNEKIRELLKKKDKNKKGENGGIGTPATRATIITDLFKRGYIERKGKNILSTKLAKEYLKILPEDLKTADNTALWWSIQEEIKEGKAKKEDLILSVLEDIKKIINSSENIKISSEVANKERESLGTCPKCKKGEIYRGEKNFYCSEYKNGCNFSLFKKMKIYNQKEIDVTNTRAKTLLAGQSILINKVPSKSGKEYDAYFKLEIKDKYINLVFDKFK